MTTSHPVVGLPSLRSVWCVTALGRFLLVGDERALFGIWRDGQAHFADGLPGIPPLSPNGGLPTLAAACDWLRRYAAGQRPAPAELTLHPAPTPFAQLVRDALLCLPYGATTTYGALAADIAARTGRPAAARAVGAAVARNRLLLVVPCHRVLGADGSLTGFAAGLDLKRRLLQLEHA